MGGCWLVGGGARVSDFFLQRIQILKRGWGGSSVSEVGGCWLVGGGARVSDFFYKESKS